VAPVACQPHPAQPQEVCGWACVVNNLSPLTGRGHRAFPPHTRQIEATDHQIHRLVYELYDLTEKEIAIVEQATA